MGENVRVSALVKYTILPKDNCVAPNDENVLTLLSDRGQHTEVVGDPSTRHAGHQALLFRSRTPITRPRADASGNSELVACT